jgi:hypothetical protein
MPGRIIIRLVSIKSAFQHLGEAFSRYKEGTSKYPRFKSEKRQDNLLLFMTVTEKSQLTLVRKLKYQH